MIRIEKALEEIKSEQVQAHKAWTDAQAKFNDKTYDEEFEDTLQRKYDEGYADALFSVLRKFAEIDLAEIKKEIEKAEGQYVVEYFEGLYEGVEDTDIYSDYFDDEEEETNDYNADPDHHFVAPKENN